MKRRDARNAAVQLVCAAGFHYGEACNFDEMYENGLASLEIEGDDYVRKLYFGVLEKLGELDALIESCLRGWKLTRLSKTTLAVLRVGAYEIVFGGVEPPVAINEAVELAKIYDDEKAPKFVNGVLNSIAVKSGRKKPAETEKKESEA
jgi:N utilization substance protein B